jgi:hypothetical protein
LAAEAEQTGELAARRQQLALRLAEEAGRLAAERDAFLARARAALATEATALLEEARRHANRLDAIDDATLCARLHRYLPQLLPGRADDRPHGQG